MSSIDRRRFIEAGVAGSVGIAAGRLAGGDVAAAEARRCAPADATPFDLEEATLADLQKKMQAGEESARSLVEKYRRRIDALDRQGPSLHAVIELNPDADDIAARLDAERASKGAAGAAARHPGPHQGQHRHGRPDDDHGRVARARRLDPRARRVRGAQAARGGRRHPRQDEPQRVGELPVHALVERVERPRRPGEEPVRARPQSLGVELGHRRAAIAASCAAIGIGTETDGSIVSPSNNCGLVGAQADRRPRQPRRHHSDCAQPGHRRADDAHRHRRGDPARRARRRGPGRPGDDGRGGEGAARLHDLPRSERARRARGSASRARPASA